MSRTLQRSPPLILCWPLALCITLLLAVTLLATSPRPVTSGLISLRISMPQRVGDMAAIPQPAANGDWFYNTKTGAIQHITNPIEKAWYEDHTINPDEIPFATEADAKAYKAAYEANKTNPSAPNPSKPWWLDTDTGIISGPLPASTQLGPPWMSFTTQAEAQAYEKAHPPTLGLGGTISSVTDAVSKISGLAMDVEDGHMWVSLGWITLGVILTAVGLAMLLRKPIEDAAGTVVKAVAL